MIFSEAMSEELMVWPEKAIFLTQRLLSLSLLMLIQSVVAPSWMVDGTLMFAIAGFKVQRRAGKLDIAAIGSELDTLNHPANRQLQGEIVSLISRHGDNA